MCTVCPVNCQLSNQYFIKFGWQIGGGAGEQQCRRAVVEQESGGGAGERRWSRRVAVEESSVGEESCVGRERRRGSCITQFWCIFLISLPHFDLWGWACYEMALPFAAWKSPGKKEHATVTKLTAISKPKTIIISLGPFEYLWLFKKKHQFLFFNLG